MPRFMSARLASAMVENAVADDDTYRAVLDEISSVLRTRAAVKPGRNVEERLASVLDLLSARSPATVRRGGAELQALLDERVAADRRLEEALARRSRGWHERLTAFGSGRPMPAGEAPGAPRNPPGSPIAGDWGGPPDIAYGKPPGPSPDEDDDW
ncbi:hypothetical protein [Kutzneria sp. NPDC052558]|uniref:hypothetical protein n=1 Tax=Kutzneria sp. NPDC052558 TaxID=3364121 RepID=UPI0037C9556B